MKKINSLSILAIIIIISVLRIEKIPENIAPVPKPTFKKSVTINPTATPKVILRKIPQQKTLANNYHIFQTFNNCGPAALSMTLSYFGINESQTVLGQQLRPYQNPQGDNDDKSVTLDELADLAEDYDLIPYHRPNGTIGSIKLFITYDIPVITRKITKAGEDIGHYRIIKGYDDTTGEIIQDDSLQGKNLRYSYDDFSALWKAYNFEYLVLIPPDKKTITEKILGEDRDIISAWKKAVDNSLQELEKDPGDINARFNLSVALYNIGDYKGSAKEFEKVENLLPFRTLWYQIEPILAYFELGNYERVFEITDSILTNGNRAFSELYLLRGEIYKNQGDNASARKEFEKAVLYNKNLKKAQDALNSI